jgi:hypothetical protein
MARNLRFAGHTPRIRVSARIELPVCRQTAQNPCCIPEPSKYGPAHVTWRPAFPDAWQIALFLDCRLAESLNAIADIATPCTSFRSLNVTVLIMVSWYSTLSR